MTMAALLGCVWILVHSLLDFNLQIPANAALFYVLCAIAASAPLQESQRRRLLRLVMKNLVIRPSPRTWGELVCSDSRHPNAWDHPHARGENVPSPSETHRHVGPSSRTWGELQNSGGYR